jgi:cathepsin D
MAGFTVNKQGFVSVNRATTGLLDGSQSGIMGLGFQSIAQTRAVPFWQALATSNQLTQPEFGIWLNRFTNISSAGVTEQDGGALTLGGTNSSLFTGDIEFLDMPAGTTPSFWLLSISALTTSGKTVKLTTDATLSAIDTGTTLIGGPSQDVRNFWANVPGSEPLTGQNEGYYGYPCSTNLGVTLSFGGKSWPISEADMVAGGDGDVCAGSIFDLNLGSTGSGNPGWVVGAAFLKNVYSVYRAQPPSVGFAQLSTNPGISLGTPSSSSVTSARGSSGTSTRSPASATTSTQASGIGSPFSSGVCRTRIVGEAAAIFVAVSVMGWSFLF